MASFTVPDVPSTGLLRRARALRRAFLLGLLAVVVLGVAGMTGHLSGTTTAAGGGYTLSVEHVQRTRAGMPADLRVVVKRPDGFDGPITLSISADYLDLLIDQQQVPQPATSTADASRVLLEFDPPPGETFQLLYKARIHPGAHRGRDAVVAVLEDGTPAATVEVHTVVLP